MTNRKAMWFVLMLMLYAMPAMAEDSLTTGSWWAEKTDDVSRIAKSAYVQGFWARFQIDCATEREKHISRSIFCPPNGILESDSINTGQIVTRVEIFYKDSRNLRVPVFGAVEYVIFSLDGVSPDILQGYLDNLRALK